MTASSHPHTIPAALLATNAAHDKRLPSGASSSEPSSSSDDFSAHTQILQHLQCTATTAPTTNDSEDIVLARFANGNETESINRCIANGAQNLSSRRSGRQALLVAAAALPSFSLDPMGSFEATVLDNQEEADSNAPWSLADGNELSANNRRKPSAKGGAGHRYRSREKLKNYFKQINDGDKVIKKKFTHLVKQYKKAEKLIGKNPAPSVGRKQKLRNIVAQINKEEKRAKKNLTTLTKKCKKTKKILKHLRSHSKNTYNKKSISNSLNDIRKIEKVTKKSHVKLKNHKKIKTLLCRAKQERLDKKRQAMNLAAACMINARGSNHQTKQNIGLNILLKPVKEMLVKGLAVGSSMTNPNASLPTGVNHTTIIPSNENRNTLNRSAPAIFHAIPRNVQVSSQGSVLSGGDNVTNGVLFNNTFAAHDMAYGGQKPQGTQSRNSTVVYSDRKNHSSSSKENTRLKTAGKSSTKQESAGKKDSIFLATVKNKKSFDKTYYAQKSDQVTTNNSFQDGKRSKRDIDISTISRNPPSSAIKQTTEMPVVTLRDNADSTTVTNNLPQGSSSITDQNNERQRKKNEEMEALLRQQSSLSFSSNNKLSIQELVEKSTNFFQNNKSGREIILRDFDGRGDKFIDWVSINIYGKVLEKVIYQNEIDSGGRISIASLHDTIESIPMYFDYAYHYLKKAIILHAKELIRRQNYIIDLCKVDAEKESKIKAEIHKIDNDEQYIPEKFKRIKHLDERYKAKIPLYAEFSYTENGEFIIAYYIKLKRSDGKDILVNARVIENHIDAFEIYNPKRPEICFTVDIIQNNGSFIISKTGNNLTPPGLDETPDLRTEPTTTIQNQSSSVTTPIRDLINDRSTPATTTDDVSIVRLHNGAWCYKPVRTFGDVLTKIGEALKSPVTEMFRESAILYNIISGKGCPDEETIEKDSNTAKKIDAVVSMVIGLLPGANPLVVTQSIIGPMLAQMGRTANNEKIDIKETNEIVNNLNFMLKFSIGEMSNSDKSKLKKETLDKPIELPRYIVRKETTNSKSGVYVNVKTGGLTRELPLVTRKGRPCVILGANSSPQEMYYDYLSKDWKLISSEVNGKTLYPVAQQSLFKTLSIGSELLKDAKPAENYFQHKDIYSVNIDGKLITCVKIGGQLIPYIPFFPTAGKGHRGFIYEHSLITDPYNQRFYKPNEVIGAESYPDPTYNSHEIYYSNKDRGWLLEPTNFKELEEKYIENIRCRRSPGGCTNIPSVETVYRVDTRSIDQISEAKGMFPRKEINEEFDDHMTHHFDGEQPSGFRSKFVSTSADLGVVIEHGKDHLGTVEGNLGDMVFDPNDTEIIYIYKIRPDNNFHHVDGSMEAAINSDSLTNAERQRLNMMLRDYGGMKEWAALGGFPIERIEAYAELTPKMLHDINYKSKEDFIKLNLQWKEVPEYNQEFARDTGSTKPYLKM